MEHEYCTPVFIDDINDEMIDYDKENIEKGNDELLIDAVRGYPHLYNSSMKEYKDVQMKENSWMEIGLLMNMSSKIFLHQYLCQFIQISYKSLILAVLN